MSDSTVVTSAAGMSGAQASTVAAGSRAPSSTSCKATVCTSGMARLTKSGSALVASEPSTWLPTTTSTSSRPFIRTPAVTAVGSPATP